MRNLKKMNNNLEAILKNASSCVRGNELNNRIQARCEVLESIAELSGMNLDERLKSIEESYKGVDLEEVLNVSPDYYRERYFALLEIVAKSIKTEVTE